jgi:hypothetical protein
MTLQRLLRSTVTKNTRTLAQKGFGVPMIAAYHTAWAELWREYSDPDDMLDDGFTVNSPAYIRARALRSQDPSVEKFIVGRRKNMPTRIVRMVPLTAAIAEGRTLAFSVVNPSGVTTSISYTVPASPTLASVCAGVRSLVEAISGIDCTDNSTSFDVKATTAGQYFRIIGADLKQFSLEDRSADPGITQDLTDIYADNPNWYGLTIDTQDKASIKAAAAWLEAKELIGVFCSADSACFDANSTTDVLAEIEALSYTRCAVMFHPDYGEPAECSALAILMANTPGSTTMAWKTLPGIRAVDLTDAQMNAIEAKNGSHYSTTASNMFFEGKTPSGEFLDTTQGIDWVNARIAERAGERLKNAKKLPYDQSTANVFASVVASVLKEGQDNKFVAEDPPFTVTPGNVLAASTTQRANREFPPTRWTFRVAGAAHKATFEGELFV